MLIGRRPRTPATTRAVALRRPTRRRCGAHQRRPGPSRLPRLLRSNCGLLCTPCSGQHDMMTPVTCWRNFEQDGCEYYVDPYNQFFGPICAELADPLIDAFEVGQGN